MYECQINLLFKNFFLSKIWMFSQSKSCENSITMCLRFSNYRVNVSVPIYMSTMFRYSAEKFPACLSHIHWRFERIKKINKLHNLHTYIHITCFGYEIEPFQTYVQKFKNEKRNSFHFSFFNFCTFRKEICYIKHEIEETSIFYLFFSIKSQCTRLFVYSLKKKMILSILNLFQTIKIIIINKIYI